MTISLYQKNFTTKTQFRLKQVPIRKLIKIYSISVFNNNNNN